MTVYDDIDTAKNVTMEFLSHPVKARPLYSLYLHHDSYLPNRLGRVTNNARGTKWACVSTGKLLISDCPALDKITH